MFIGHELLRNELLLQYKLGKMPHANIFFGPDFIGKYRFAKALAVEMLGDNFKLEYFEIAPKVAKNGKSLVISAANVKRLVSGLKTKARGGQRVVVINRADLMTREAQNSLLKILEEPNSGTIFFLITSKIESVLPTIQSRAVLRKMSMVDVNNWSMQMRAEFAKLPEDFQVALNGLPELFLALEGENRDIIEMRLNNAIKLVKATSYERFAVGEVMAKKLERDELILTLDLACKYAYDAEHDLGFIEKLLETSKLMSKNLNKRLLFAQLTLNS
jgi:DNA polymerase III delta prime subunit